ncbi:MAG: hypothetical protein ACREJM_06465 [Candidatus Saccharimonadales bacterium]
MTARRLFLAAAWVATSLSPAFADDVKTVTDANGQTWREVHRTIQQPVTETQCLERQRLVYQETCDVQMCDTVRTYTVPVTEYRWESYWKGRYNPFVQPYLAQRLVPYTHWETRTETVKVPLTRRQVLPVTQTIKVPYTTQRVENHDVVVSRQLIGPSPTALAASPPTPAIGGVQKFSPDNRQPPKAGASPTSMPSSGGNGPVVANRGGGSAR